MTSLNQASIDSHRIDTREGCDFSDSTSAQAATQCPMPGIAKLIGGKWKLILLQILVFQGTKRFGELKRALKGITQTMLTTQLRALEADGLVTRKLYPEVPPRVEYTATPLAMELKDMFKAMHHWWQKHLQDNE